MPRGKDKLIVPTFEKREAIATNRVTRIGEISPLWQNIQSLGQIFEGLIIIWQNFEPIYSKFCILLGQLSLR